MPDPVEASGKGIEGNSETSPAAPLPALTEPTPILTKDEIKAFVGKNASYYSSRWSPLLQGQDWSGFNWAACLLSVFWFPYRKMYAAAGAYFGMLFLLTLLTEATTGAEPDSGLSHLPRLIAAAVCGGYANKWYFTHATKIIHQIRSKGLTDAALLHELAQRGGTSWGAVLVFIGLAIFLTAAFLK